MGLTALPGPEAALGGAPPRLGRVAEGLPELESQRLHRDFTDFVPVGKGGFGRVLKARHRLDGEVYAIKVIQVSVEATQRGVHVP